MLSLNLKTVLIILALMNDRELFLLGVASASIVAPQLIVSGKIVHDRVKNGLSLEDAVVRNSKLAGIVCLASSLAGSAVLEYKSEDFGIPSVLHLTLPMSFLSGYFAYYCSNLLGRLNRPWVKNVPKYLWFNFKNLLKISFIQDESILALQRTIFRDPSRFELDYSTRLLDFGSDYNDFLDAYKTSIEGLKLKKQSLDDKLIRGVVNGFVKLWSKISKDKISLLLSRANSYLVSGNLSNFNACWDELMNSRSGDNFVPLRVAQVMTYECVSSGNTNLEGILNNAWRELPREIFDNDPEKYLEDVEGKSVYRVNMFDSLKSMIVLLEGNEHDLNDQMNNLLTLDKFLDRSKHQVAKPLRIIKYKDRFFLAEQHAKGERLTEFLERNLDQDVLERALEFTAVIHAKLPVKQVSVDYLSYLRRKLSISSIHENLKSSILDSIDVVLDRFNTPNVVFDRDSHTDNYHIHNNVIIGYDLPSRGCTHKEMDVSKMVNRGCFFSRDQHGLDRKIGCLLNGYLYPYQRLAGVSESEKDFVVRCLNATAFKAITYFLFVHTEYRLKMLYAVGFLENSLVDIGEVLERDRTIKHQDISKYKSLISCIKELIIIGQVN